MGVSRDQRVAVCEVLIYKYSIRSDDTHNYKLSFRTTYTLTSPLTLFL